jgi:predicted ABC-type ATPase
MYLFAGPNGSGKSSYLSKQLPKGTIIYDPDKIARDVAIEKGFSPNEVQRAVYNSEIIKLGAMRKLEAEIRNALNRGISFATETVLNKSKAYKNFLENAREKGYKIHLWYVGTESAGINIRRVKDRISKGGHGVPKEDIVKRYEGSLESLKQFTEMADEVKIYDNSVSKALPSLVLHMENGNIIVQLLDMPRWVEENVYLPSNTIVALQAARKEAIKIAREMTEAKLITDAVKDETYEGKIIAVAEKHVIQQLTKEHIILHRKEDLPVELSPGDHLAITKMAEGKSFITKHRESRRAKDRGFER